MIFLILFKIVNFQIEYLSSQLEVNLFAFFITTMITAIISNPINDANMSFRFKIDL